MRTPSLILLTILLGVGVSYAAEPEQLLGPEKTTNLHFFLHDTLSGKDPSAVLVARGEGRVPKPEDPVPFSSLFATDDLMTEGPEVTSKVVGNAQGLYIASGRGKMSLVLGMDFELTDGSAFVVYSRNPISNPNGRELAIVGGRGKFRMARGFALLQTHFMDVTNGDAIIEYNVTLYHH